MGGIGKWLVASLVSVATFAVAVWISGAIVLVPLLASPTDRWAVASGIGVSLAAFAALWGQWWATRPRAAVSAASGDVDGAPDVITPGQRSIDIGRDNIGIVSTGDDTTNTQHQ